MHRTRGGFVGFMAGWNRPQGMEQTTSAVIGAFVTTYATFLPCFAFIFLGAPYIEVLRGNKNLTGALTGITACTNLSPGVLAAR